MYFEDEYFKSEERDGFNISSMMKRYWASHIEVLSEFERVCNKIGVIYYADYGTLLGAVRHKGFIPWDDDMDICMLRGDYDRFRTLAPEEFQDGVMIYNNMATSLAPLRVVNTCAPMISEDFLVKYHMCPHSTGIDIYVLDKLPDSEQERKEFRELHQCIKYAAQRTDKAFMSEAEHKAIYANDAYSEEEFEHLLAIIEQVTGIKLDRAANMSVQLTNILDKVQSRYWETDSKEVVYLHGWARGARKPQPIKLYGEGVRLPFENIDIMAPEQYNDILIERFGENYMIPLREGAGHEYPGYRRSQQILIDTFAKCGLQVPDFLLDSEII